MRFPGIADGATAAGLGGAYVRTEPGRRHPAHVSSERRPQGGGTYPGGTHLDILHQQRRTFPTAPIALQLHFFRPHQGPSRCVGLLEKIGFFFF